MTVERQRRFVRSHLGACAVPAFTLALPRTYRRGRSCQTDVIAVAEMGDIPALILMPLSTNSVEQRV